MARSIKVALDLDTRKFDSGMSNVQRRTDGLTQSFGGLQAAIAAVATGFVTKNIIDSTLQMENFRSTLTAYLGSQTLANEELQRLSDLAKGLPQDVDDLTNAFVVLTRNGIDTSSASMEAFSKVAAGNSKSFSQLGEAVADALTGEFERLKEFGIKVSQENDKFTIRMADGSTKVVDSARDVVDAVRAMGEEGGKFANVAAGPLNQAFSNLRGAMFEATSTIGDGFAPALAEAAGKMSAFIDRNKEFLREVGEKIGTVLQFFVDNLNAVGAALLVVFGPGMLARIVAINAAMAANPLGAILTVVGLAVAGFISLYNEVGSVGTAFKVIANTAVEAVNTIMNFFSGAGNFIAEIFRGLGEYLKDAINPFEDADFTQSMTDAYDRAKSAFQAEIDGQGPFALPFDIPPETFASVRRDLEEFSNLQSQIFSEGAVNTNVSLLALEQLSEQYKKLGEDLVANGSISSDEFTAEMERINARKAELVAAQEQANQNTETEVENINLRDEAEQKAFDKWISRHNERMALTDVKFENDLKDIEFEMQKIGLTENQIELLNAENELERQRQEEIAKVTAALESEIITEEERDAILAEINGKYEEQQVKIRDAMIASQEYQQSFSAGWTQAWIKYAEDAENYSKTAHDMFNTFAQGMEDAFVQFLTTGKLSFKDLIDSMYKEIARFIAKQAVKKFLGLIGAAVGGPLGALLGAIGGGLASGGPAMGNVPYLVGEEGPEIFVPKVPGYVIPNRASMAMLNGGGASTGVTNVNYTIIANDAQSFRSMLAREKEFLYNVTEAGRRSLP